MDGLFQRVTGKLITEVFKEEGSKHYVMFLPTNGALRLKWEAVEKLFDPIVNQILTEIETVESSVVFRRFDCLLLVGGFAESSYLQQAVGGKFTQRAKVLVPDQAQLAIIKGAVRFGQNPGLVKTRLSRYTYGISITTEFKEGYHREGTEEYIEGIRNTTKLFDVILTKGDEVERNSEKSKTYLPSYKTQASITISVYVMSSTPCTPQYITDVGVRKLGTVRVRIPKASEASNNDREIQVKFKFGDTEIRVEAFNIFTGDRAETVVDFL